MLLFVGDAKSMQYGQNKNWTAQSVSISEFQSGCLIISIYHARNLLPSDSDGNSDPYVIANYAGEEAISEVVYSTLNPVWNLKLTIPIKKIPKNNMGLYPILLKMYDKDVIVQDDFMGGVIVNVEDGIKEKYISVNPK